MTLIETIKMLEAQHEESRIAWNTADGTTQDGHELRVVLSDLMRQLKEEIAALSDEIT